MPADPDLLTCRKCGALTPAVVGDRCDACSADIYRRWQARSAPPKAICATCGHAFDAFAVEAGICGGCRLEARRAENVASAEHEDRWAEIRHRRAALLAACDWTQLPDVPATTRGAWAAYRQALRDITEFAAPDLIIWPTAPDNKEV